jgi:putative transport protein
MTTTPALASVLELLRYSGSLNLEDDILSMFAISYPVSILGIMIGIAAWEKYFSLSPEQTPGEFLLGKGGSRPKLTRKVVCIKAWEQPIPPTVRQVIEENQLSIRFGRMQTPTGTSILPNGRTLLLAGTLAAIIGTESEIERAVAILGVESTSALAAEDSAMVTVHFVVSKADTVGVPLRKLFLSGDFGANITKIRRGDVEFTPTKNTRLELGDLLRVICMRGDVQLLEQVFGNSHQTVSTFNVVGLTLGITLGLLLGIVTIPLFGTATLTLGVAGGPLLCGIVLSVIRRIGPVTFIISPVVNSTLRNFCLLMFTAGFGLRMGESFFSALTNQATITIAASALIGSIVITVANLAIFHRVLKVPFVIVLALIAGVQTCPAVLTFVVAKSSKDEVISTYASYYLFAVVVKIIACQLFFLAL